MRFPVFMASHVWDVDSDATSTAHLTPICPELDTPMQLRGRQQGEGRAMAPADWLSGLLLPLWSVYRVENNLSFDCLYTFSQKHLPSLFCCVNILVEQRAWRFVKTSMKRAYFDLFTKMFCRNTPHQAISLQPFFFFFYFLVKKQTHFASVIFSDVKMFFRSPLHQPWPADSLCPLWM